MRGLLKYLFYILIAVFIYQCKKKDANEPIQHPAKSTTITTTTTTTTSTITPTSGSPSYSANILTSTLSANNSVYDTIFPSSYFPAFPNSYWRYIDTNGDTSASYTSSSYVLDNYIKPIYNFISASAYVPLYNGIPIWGYFEHQTGPLYYASLNMPRILSDSLPVGTSWDDTFGAGHIGSRTILSLDTTIAINGISYDSTIVMEYSNRPTGGLKTPYMRRYFTKNIGITREESLVINYGPPPTYIISYIPSVTKNLQSYFINH